MTDGFGATFFVPLTDEQFGHIGKITAILAAIETTIDTCILQLAGISNIHTLNVMVGKSSFTAKLSILRKLAELKSASDVWAVTKSACDAIDGLTNARNHVVHGEWGYGMTPGPPEAFREGKVYARTNRQDSLFAASDLPDLIDRVEDAAAKIYEASAAILGMDPNPGFPVSSLFNVDVPHSSPPKARRR